MEETRSQTKPYWFRAKTYGWGWTPCTWQGWTVLAVWAVVFSASVIGCAANASNGVQFALLFAVAVGSTVALAWLAWRTGEPASWRWGRH